MRRQTAILDGWPNRKLFAGSADWSALSGEMEAKILAQIAGVFRERITAKALPKDALVEITGKLRHDRWQDQAAKTWRGKIYIAVDPGEGTVRSKGLATAEAA